jgi:hypothetical protein
LPATNAPPDNTGEKQVDFSPRLKKSDGPAEIQLDRNMGTK